VKQHKLPRLSRSTFFRIELAPVKQTFQK